MDSAAPGVDPVPALPVGAASTPDETEIDDGDGDMPTLLSRAEEANMQGLIHTPSQGAVANQQHLPVVGLAAGSDPLFQQGCLPIYSTTAEFLRWWQAARKLQHAVSPHACAAASVLPKDGCRVEGRGGGVALGAYLVTNNSASWDTQA